MQFFPHLSNDDTAIATVRLHKNELKALRNFMHTPEYHQHVGFPNGVRLYYRSKGWYRLDTTNNTVACKKISVALAILRKFKRDYDAAVAADIRRLLLDRYPELQTNAHTEVQTEARVPADPRKLERLAHQFAKPRTHA